jgi:hypothetical protein
MEQVILLSYAAAELRNGKVHSTEYTSAHGMKLARKIVLGFDEVQVGYSSIRSWIKRSRFQNETDTSNRLSAAWRDFPGIVPSLWKALGAAESG